MAAAYWRRAREREKESGKWIAILCQAQGMTVTLKDLIGETDDERRLRMKAEQKHEREMHRKAAKNLTKWRSQENGK